MFTPEVNAAAKNPSTIKYHPQTALCFEGSHASVLKLSSGFHESLFF